MTIQRLRNKINWDLDREDTTIQEFIKEKSVRDRESETAKILSIKLTKRKNLAE